MTKQELIEMLEELDDDTEIRIMEQMRWPFECAIAGVAKSTDLDEFTPEGGKGVVYLVQGNQLGYGDSQAWDVCRRY